MNAPDEYMRQKEIKPYFLSSWRKGFLVMNLYCAALPNICLLLLQIGSNESGIIAFQIDIKELTAQTRSIFRIQILFGGITIK